MEAMTPLEVTQVSRASGESKLPLDEAELLTVDGANVNLSTWKLAEDGRGSILRLQEISGHASHVQLGSKYFKFVQAWLASELEDNLATIDVRDGQLEVEMKPFQTLTLRVETEASSSQAKN